MRDQVRSHGRCPARDLVVTPGRRAAIFAAGEIYMSFSSYTTNIDMLSRVVLAGALLVAGADAFMPTTPALTSLRTSTTQLSATKINVNSIKAGEAKVVDQVVATVNFPSHKICLFCI